MKKVLIIEDNEDVRLNTADILELANYEVLTAENGEAGVKKALEIKPDLILCDVMMPRMDGFEVLRILSENVDTMGIPFVFLTAKTERSDQRKGMNLGADDYLTKPFEEHELLDALEVRLRKNDFLTKKFERNLDGINSLVEDASTYFEMENLQKEYGVKTYDKKEFLFKEGSPAHKLYLVQSGTIKGYRNSSEGKEMVTALYSAGDFIGSLSLLGDAGNYLESAQVIDQAEICRIPKEDFISLLYGNKTVSRKFIGMISNNLIGIQDKLYHAAFASVRQRMAKALIELYKNGIIGDDKSSGKDMPREDLASIIGTAKETAIRMLSEFKDEGLISTGTNRRILIINQEKLERIAEFS